jgi:integrase
MSVKQFLDSLTNPNTRNLYRRGLNLFTEWYSKNAEQTLLERKEDLTQKQGEDLIDYKNRASRFERKIEEFHSWMKTKNYTINSARANTLGIIQLFRYYHMPIQRRRGSSISQTIKTTRNFPLTIEHVRAMFKVANLKERLVLSMATDLGLRIGDFIQIRKDDLPDLKQTPPLAFEVRTMKEKVVAEGFLSSETVELLKNYLKTTRKKQNPFVFAGNERAHITEEGINKMLRVLADKAQIELNGKSLTFHCFRKMFLSAAIDSGIGLTAGKKLCGKAIPRSDDTYLTTVKLKEKFIQLKKFLTIRQSVKSEDQQLEKLGSLVAKLAEELEQQKIFTQAVTGENLKIRREFKNRVAELNEEIAVTRLVGEQVAKIGEDVRKWQEEKGEIEAKIAGIESFQKLVLGQPDEVILEFIKDVRRQLREQRNGK